MSRKYILYAHDGSGNHGCEALVRSTAGLLNVDKAHLVLVSARPEEDVYYGIDQLCTVIKKGTRGTVSKTDPAFIRGYLKLKIQKDYLPLDRLGEVYGAGARPGDVALSIGGDTYCYGGTAQLAAAHTMWKEGRLKTVYWGCSIEPELLEDKAIAQDISRYDLITARETISYEALKRVNPNTVLVADSAFLLEKEDVKLPEGFADCDLVGINSSPLIENSETIPGMARENYQRLIEYILDQTNMKILLIPHVVWKGVDDRTVLSDLYERYKSSGRVAMIDDCNCKRLKGYISQCRFFVGARTHATIAAYSTGVPTLVVGYSVKAKGIARDLFGTDEHYVLPVQNLHHDKDLTRGFEWLQENENSICQRLKTELPAYTNRIYRGIEALNNL